MKRKSIQKNSSQFLKIELMENKKLLGDIHLETIKSYQKLIQCLFNEQLYQECLDYVQIAINIYDNEINILLKDKLQPLQKDKVLKYMEYFKDAINLQLRIYELQDYRFENRLKAIERLLKQQNNVYGESSIQYTSILQRKARILFDNKDKLSSMSCLEQCLNIQSKILPKNHIQFAETYSLMGDIYSEYGLFNEALANCQVALNIHEIINIQEMQSNSNKIQLAHMKVQISGILYKCNKIKESIQIIQQALNIYQNINLKQLTPNDIKQYSFGLYQYSINLRDQGFLDEALQFANLDYKIKKEYKLDTLDTGDNLGQIHYLKGDIKQSKQFFEQVLEQIKQLYEKEEQNKRYLKRYINLLTQLTLISQLLDLNYDALKYQKIKQTITTKLNFQKTQKKINLKSSTTLFQSNEKSLESFPSFSSLQSTRLPSLTNLSPFRKANSKKQTLILSSRHSLSDLNTVESPSRAINFNRSLSLKIQNQPKIVTIKQQSQQIINSSNK